MSGVAASHRLVSSGRWEAFCVLHEMRRGRSQATDLFAPTAPTAPTGFRGESRVWFRLWAWGLKGFTTPRMATRLVAPWPHNGVDGGLQPRLSPQACSIRCDFACAEESFPSGQRRFLPGRASIATRTATSLPATPTGLSGGVISSHGRLRLRRGGPWRAGCLRATALMGGFFVPWFLLDGLPPSKLSPGSVVGVPGMYSRRRLRFRRGGLRRTYCDREFSD